MIQRTHSRHIENTSLDTFGGKQISRLQRSRHQHTIGDQGNVIFITLEDSLARRP